MAIRNCSSICYSPADIDIEWCTCWDVTTTLLTLMHCSDMEINIDAYFFSFVSPVKTKRSIANFSI